MSKHRMIKIQLSRYSIDVMIDALTACNSIGYKSIFTTGEDADLRDAIIQYLRDEARR